MRSVARPRTLANPIEIRTIDNSVTNDNSATTKTGKVSSCRTNMTSGMVSHPLSASHLAVPCHPSASFERPGNCSTRTAITDWTMPWLLDFAMQQGRTPSLLTEAADPRGHSWTFRLEMWPQAIDTGPCDVENCILPVVDQRQNPIRNSPTMKKRQARNILRQVLQQGRPINLPDGRRASKRAIHRARESDSDLPTGSALQEWKHAAALAGRFDSARRRQEQSFNRGFKRATRSRARRAQAGVVASR